MSAITIPTSCGPTFGTAFGSTPRRRPRRASLVCRTDRVRQPALHLTRRGRLVLVLVALLLVAVPVALGTMSAAADGPVAAREVHRHVVAPGETLWQIARGIAGPDQDVRDVVQELVDLNDLSGSGLIAGTTIVVPIAR